MKTPLNSLLFCAICCMLFTARGVSQTPRSLYLKDLRLSGSFFSDPQGSLAHTGLRSGQWVQIPGEAVSEAIRQLWKTGLFSDIQIETAHLSGDTVELHIRVAERQRISQIVFEQQIPQKTQQKLQELLRVQTGSFFDQAALVESRRLMRNYFVEKGHYQAHVHIKTEPDEVLRQHLLLRIEVNKGPRFHLKTVRLKGNEALSRREMRKAILPLKTKKSWQFWKRAPFSPQAWKTARQNLLAAYQNKGFQDARLLRDSLYTLGKGVVLELEVEAGSPYYYRSINWLGNVRFSTDTLHQLLGIRPGDRYSPQQLEQQLYAHPAGRDISALYLDQGYLFVQVEPLITYMANDSVDVLLRITEGPQASIRNVHISGNTKTSQQVILRELRTIPGHSFSRAELLRSQRELMALGYFNPQSLKVVPIPHAETGTVDLEYQVEEQQTDQFQLQLGWNPRSRSGGSATLASGFVGTLQFNFNNFALKRLLDPWAWKEYGIPAGEGQKLSLAFQSNGGSYQNYSISFLEPWLGGKKPNSLGFQLSHQVFQDISTQDSSQRFRNRIFSGSLDFSQRIRFPDDYTRSSTSLAYKYYDISQPGQYFQGFENDSRAFVHILALRQQFTRSTIDYPIFPRRGAVISLDMEFTPPYSLFAGKKDYENLAAAEKFHLLEYHKWKFSSSFYQSLPGSLVLKLQAQAGYIGGYHPGIGTPPFERFVLGGSGLGVGNALSGVEAVPLRGYQEQSLNNGQAYYPLYQRFVAELRYPISFEGGMPLWILGFAEAGNAWQGLKAYRPFELRKSAGLGLRIQLPMLGIIGLDWGYGFDQDEQGKRSGSRFHFIIGQQF